MRWFAIVVMPLVACTAANPAFDLLDDDGGSAASQGGPDDDAGGSTDAGEDASTGASASCGPFVEPKDVQLLLDGKAICGNWVATGTVELITADEIHLRCNSEFDSDCLPDALAVLRVGYGLPPELVVEPGRAMQLQWYTDDKCDFAMTRLQAGNELRETFGAVGAAGIFQTQPVSSGIEVEMQTPCDCIDGCCALPEGQYRLVKQTDEHTVALAEGEEADATVDGFEYRFRSIAANVNGDCRKAFHWQSVRL